MNNKLALIIPYFGKLPQYMQLFWNSCAYNKEVDFFLFTDDISVNQHILPNNVFVYIRSFEEIKKLFRTKLSDDQLYLETPYKLCDYKPTYGLVFQEYISSYDYWGHCDIDLIFGDIMKFLRKIDYQKYDRVFPYGHLSIYKNIDNINTTFLKKLPASYPITANFNYVKHTTYPCNFDEYGCNIIFRHYEYKFYDKCHHLQVQDQQLVFRSQYKSSIPEIITFEHGQILSYKNIDSHIHISEFIYIHLQDRKVMPILIKNMAKAQSFLITHKGFIDFNKNDITNYLTTYGRNDTVEETKLYIRNRKYNETKGRINKFIREIKVYRLKGVYNIILRLYSILNRRSE